MTAHVSLPKNFQSCVALFIYKSLYLRTRHVKYYTLKGWKIYCKKCLRLLSNDDYSTKKNERKHFSDPLYNFFSSPKVKSVYIWISGFHTRNIIICTHKIFRLSEWKQSRKRKNIDLSSVLLTFKIKWSTKKLIYKSIAGGWRIMINLWVDWWTTIQYSAINYRR